MPDPGLILVVGREAGSTREVAEALGTGASVLGFADLSALKRWVNEDVASDQDETVDSRAMILSFGMLRLGLLTREAWVGDEIRFPVSAQLFDVLCILARANGRSVRFETLLAKVWKDRSHCGSERVRTCMRRLRRMLEARCVPVAIASVPGEGFRLVALEVIPLSVQAQRQSIDATAQSHAPAGARSIMTPARARRLVGARRRNEEPRGWASLPRAGPASRLPTAPS